MQRAAAPPRVAGLVNVESALTDVLCVVSAGTVLEGLVAGTADGGGAALGLARFLGIGLAAGVGVGLLSAYGLRRLVRTDRAYPIVLSGLFVLYALVDAAGGCAALAVFSCAVALGNAPAFAAHASASERIWLQGRVTSVHGTLAFMAKSFFFTLIGTLLAPPWPLLALGAALGVVLFVTRWPAALVALAGSGFSRAESGMVVACVPRGLAAGVLSLAPVAAGVPGAADFPIVVFAACVTTILLFAIAFARAKRRLAGEATPGAAPAGVAVRVLP
jgi:NhaP-type Na+/H+ and K+/H+ antiporter